MVDAAIEDYVWNNLHNVDITESFIEWIDRLPWYCGYNYDAIRDCCNKNIVLQTATIDKLTQIQDSVSDDELKGSIFPILHHHVQLRSGYIHIRRANTLRRLRNA